VNTNWAVFGGNSSKTSMQFPNITLLGTAAG
jgi:hypothetical protein